MEPKVNPGIGVQQSGALQVEGEQGDTNQRKCQMIGCSLPAYRSLAIAPATVVELCAEHFAQEGGTDEDEQVA